MRRGTFQDVSRPNKVRIVSSIAPRDTRHLYPFFGMSFRLSSTALSICSEFFDSSSITGKCHLPLFSPSTSPKSDLGFFYSPNAISGEIFNTTARDC